MNHPNNLNTTIPTTTDITKINRPTNPKSVRMNYQIKQTDSDKLFKYINHKLTYLESIQPPKNMTESNAFITQSYSTPMEKSVSNRSFTANPNNHSYSMNCSSCSFNSDSSSLYIDPKFLQPKTLSNEEYLARCLKNSHVFSTIPVLIGHPCGICFEYFQSGEFLRRLTCQHVFHRQCIDEWFHYNLDDLSCPNCRQSQYYDED